MNEMTEERLAELRMYRNRQKIAGKYNIWINQAVIDAVDEIDRLHAEVERLWPWALNDFKECPECIKCVACGGRTHGGKK